MTPIQRSPGAYDLSTYNDRAVRGEWTAVEAEEPPLPGYYRVRRADGDETILYWRGGAWYCQTPQGQMLVDGVEEWGT